MFGETLQLKKSHICDKCCMFLSFSKTIKLINLPVSLCILHIRAVMLSRFNCMITVTKLIHNNIIMISIEMRKKNAVNFFFSLSFLANESQSKWIVFVTIIIQKL